MRCAVLIALAATVAWPMAALHGPQAVTNLRAGIAPWDTPTLWPQISSRQAIAPSLSLPCAGCAWSIAQLEPRSRLAASAPAARGSQAPIRSGDAGRHPQH